MIVHLALAILALAQPQPTEESGLLIASDDDWSTSVRLIETDDAISFEITAPPYVLPTVAFDITRNGVVDRNVDFQVSVKEDGSACFQYLIRDGASTTCKPLGERGTLSQSRSEKEIKTTLRFLKRDVSGDGFGFGFGVNLWNLSGHYATSLAGGDYQFGGRLSLVGDGPNFKGNQRPNIPSPILPALNRYQGCVNKALDALGTLVRSMAQQIRALPNTCAGERSIALTEGVDALVTAGTEAGEATGMMRGYLEAYDNQIAVMAERIESGGK